jgi:GH24 family phage-related lysozyme (muramidase)
MQNPFEYGRELAPGELIDRDAELQEVHETLTRGGKLFLIGPRRFGKTSIHNVAAHRARQDGAVVLRYNVEAFPQVHHLIAALVADMARTMSGPVERVAQSVNRLFQRLRPTVTYNPLDQTWNASIGIEPQADKLPQLVEALNALEAAAAESARPVGLILDEVQHLLIPGGPAGEGQLRAAVQQHRHVGYVFAGSDTRFLTSMTTDAARPFYRLGQIRVLGPVPRDHFLDFLTASFARLPIIVEAGALEAILDAAEDVPYNVQQLAGYIWAAIATEEHPSTLTRERVAELRDELAARLDPLYSAVWVALTTTQQRALQAVVYETGVGIYRGEVLRRHDLTASSMKKAVDALLDRNVVRREARAGVDRLRLEDPLFGSWIRTATH